MFRLVVLILLFSACGPVIAIEAECGLVVEAGDYNAERSDIVTCQHAAVKNGLTTCDLMQGVHVQFMETSGWTDSYSRRVSGITWCPGSKASFDLFSTIQVGNGQLHPAYAGALIHELRHLQECGQADIADHTNWKEDGVYDAIERARHDARTEGDTK